MKTELPERSLRIKNKMLLIVNEILSAAKDKVSKIILFGSYARGDWVRDTYMEGHITYSYQSDLDILIILKKGKYGKYYELELEGKIEKRLERNKPQKDPWLTFITEPMPTFIIEPIGRVNEQLKKGQYFFSDIKKEGILFYDDGDPLSEKKDLSKTETREIAQDDYDYWFKRGDGFLEVTKFCAFERNDYNLAAFELHQATESFYNALLLVFTGYKPKLHDINKLRARVNNYHDDLLKIFHFDTAERIECFKLLRIAYTEARYNKNYRITKEQLVYLMERVEKLKNVTEKICLSQIESYKE